MSGSMNEATLIGNVVADPEQRFMNNGKPVANLRLATNETWKDRDGKRQERTEYHRIVVFNEGICRVISSYVKKGSKVLIRGQIQTRSYEKDSSTRYVTEIVLQGFNASLILLDRAEGPGGGAGGFDGDQAGYQAGGDFEDSIPF